MVLLNLIAIYSMLCIVTKIAIAQPVPYEFNLNINNNFNLNFELQPDGLIDHPENPKDPSHGEPSHGGDDDDYDDPTLPRAYKKNPKLFNLHKEMIHIESISGQEYEMSYYLINYLRKEGLNIELIPTPDGRNNIYAWYGDSKSTKVLLTTHFDTVPPFFEYRAARDEEDRIYGRGANDDKGSIAAQLIAAEELLKAGEIGKNDVSFLFVVSEEVGGIGMRSADAYLKEHGVNWTTVIYGEPTENKLAVGHKGIYYFDLGVTGIASHSGYPELGIDANAALVDIMYDLNHYKWPSDKLLGETTINIGLFEGDYGVQV
ncbi:unnamed protein product [Ambrosiozyma monospora]|uniref:Unnamed protein product n=1 Tax=Ambrosiozyma monospora TaxID=43982 RepID=A0ACB5TCX8_AMBMO|nr:unnamed protein product [Ambrosiozyma monospora]